VTRETIPPARQHKTTSARIVLTELQMTAFILKLYHFDFGIQILDFGSAAALSEAVLYQIVFARETVRSQTHKFIWRIDAKSKI
jgi:hypothetical protein